MNEDDARTWCEERFSTRAFDRLVRFAEMVIDENERQNLISPTTCSSIWSRHITDSAQLILLAGSKACTWIDIGSGAGFPGVVVGAATDLHVALVEPRARRAEFLRGISEALGLTNITVHQARAEAVTMQADVISARAVAGISDLLAMSGHMRHSRTRLILPRGRNGASEVAELPANVRTMFHVEQSVTSSESVIVVGQGVNG